MLRPLETILVVDDEPSIRTLIADILQALGYTVLQASHGEEALSLAAFHPGSIELLVTDVRMQPAMNGTELAARLRALRPETRVLYISGFPGNSDIAGEVMRREADFLAKPFGMAALERKVRRVLGLALAQAGSL